jgi:hypothetical protein
VDYEISVSFSLSGSSLVDFFKSSWRGLLTTTMFLEPKILPTKPSDAGVCRPSRKRSPEEEKRAEALQYESHRVIPYMSASNTTTDTPCFNYYHRHQDDEPEHKRKHNI